MMKKLSFLVSLFLFVITVSSCGRSNGYEEMDLSYMSNLNIDLSDKDGLTIAKGEVDSDSVNLLADDGKEKMKKNMIFATNGKNKNKDDYIINENVEKVSFNVHKNQNGKVRDKNGNALEEKSAISQDQIDGQVNKLYIANGYTFMQLIPILDEKFCHTHFDPSVYLDGKFGSESGLYHYYDKDGLLKSEDVYTRPDVLTCDSNGIALFDKGDYYTSPLSQSFVIDNNSGLIYEIEEGIHIHYITSDGLVIATRFEDSDYETSQNMCEFYDFNSCYGQKFSDYFLNDYNVYKMSIVDDNLVFTDVVPNKDINVDGIMNGKNGWTFISNSTVNQVDYDNKRIYLKSNNGVEILVSNYGETISYDFDKQKYSMFVDGVFQDIPNNGFTAYGFEMLRCNLGHGLFKNVQFGFGEQISGFYESKKIYSQQVSGVLFESSIIINVNEDIRIKWLDDKYDAIIMEHEGAIYAKSVNLIDYLNTNTIFTISDFTKITNINLYKYSKDYYINVGAKKILVDNVFYTVDATSTTYYRLVSQNDTVVLEKLEDKIYSQNTYVFQPINK